MLPLIWKRLCLLSLSLSPTYHPVLLHLILSSLTTLRHTILFFLQQCALSFVCWVVCVSVFSKDWFNCDGVVPEMLCLILWQAHEKGFGHKCCHWYIYLGRDCLLSLSLSYLPSSLTSFDTVQFDNTATLFFSFCSSVPCLLCVGSYVWESVSVLGVGWTTVFKGREVVGVNYPAKFRINLSWRLHMHDRGNYLEVVGCSWASNIYAWIQPRFFFFFFFMPRQPLQCLG